MFGKNKIRKIKFQLIFIVVLLGNFHLCYAENKKIYLICDTIVTIKDTTYDRNSPESVEKRRSSVLIDLSTGKVLEGSFAEGSDKLPDFESHVDYTRIYGGGRGTILDRMRNVKRDYIIWSYSFDRGTGAFEVTVWSRTLGGKSYKGNETGLAEQRYHELGTCKQNQGNKF